MLACRKASTTSFPSSPRACISKASGTGFHAHRAGAGVASCMAAPTSAASCAEARSTVRKRAAAHLRHRWRLRQRLESSAAWNGRVGSTMVSHPSQEECTSERTGGLRRPTKSWVAAGVSALMGDLSARRGSGLPPEEHARKLENNQRISRWLSPDFAWREAYLANDRGCKQLRTASGHHSRALLVPTNRDCQRDGRSSLARCTHRDRMPLHCAAEAE